MKKTVLTLAAGLFAIALSGQAGADERHHASVSAQAKATEPAAAPAQAPAPAKAAAKKKKNPRKSSAHFHPRDGK
jgi:hypothetical protein